MRLELFLAGALFCQPIEELIPEDHLTSGNHQMSLVVQHKPDEAFTDWAIVAQKSDPRLDGVRRVMFPSKGPKDKHTRWKIGEEQTPPV